MSEPYVYGFSVTNGNFACLAWGDDKLSNRELRKVVSKFKTDHDFVEEGQLEWKRIYHTNREMKNALPKYR